jgi:hypothetical protein
MITECRFASLNVKTISRGQTSGQKEWSHSGLQSCFDVKTATALMVDKSFSIFHIAG